MNLQTFEQTILGQPVAFEGLIKNKAEFVNDAIGSDGRGHFLAQYDGRENRFGAWFIYRIN